MQLNSAIKKISLPTSITIDNVDELFSHIRQLNPHGSEVFTIDASEVSMITTPAVQLILSLEKTLHQEHLKITLVNPSENFKETFKILGLEEHLNLWSASNAN